MAYLNIKEKLVSGESKKKANKTAVANVGNTTDMTWEYLEEHVCETSFEDGKIYQAVEMLQDQEVVGYFSNEISIDIDLAAEIVGYYIKKLNKLKTVLEATKE